MYKLLFAILALLAASTASAQSIIVNEFFRSGTLSTGDEWIEVVLLTDLTATELQAYLVGDSQGATSSKLSAYRFANMSDFASDFPAGTIIVVSGDTGPAVDSSYDPAGGDWNLTLRTSGGNITIVTGGGDLAGTDVVWVDITATGTAIGIDGFCVNYDSTPGTFGASCPVTITAPGNVTGSVLGGDVTTQAANAGSWTSSVALASMTPGQPNGGANTTSIDDLRAMLAGTPLLSLDSPSVIEGNSGDMPSLLFTATLDIPANGDCVFSAETFDAGGPNEATPGVDYVASSFPSLTIPDGMQSVQFSVPVIGDDLIEGDEIVTIDIFGEPFECDIFSAAGVGTIIDDDFKLPTLEIDDVSVVEGTDAGVTEAVFTVTLAGLAGRPARGGGISVDYASVDGSAIAPADYASTSGTLVFVDGGPLSQTITVPIVRDNIFEGDESFTVVLSNPQGATLDVDTGTGTIENDDGFPVPSVEDVSALEGSGGGVTAFNFTVTLSNPSSTPANFLYATADGSAVSPGDYSGTGALIPISFAPLQTQQMVTVNVVADDEPEADETFALELYDLVIPALEGGGPVLIDSATGTILNDDSFMLSVADASVTEGTGPGSTTLDFVVSLSAAPLPQTTVTVDYATAAGTALSPDDFAASSGSLSFTPTGPLSQTISVPVVRDAIDENDEGLSLQLSNAVGASIADGDASGTIIDDDLPPLPQVADQSIVEGDAGSQAMLFTISLSQPSSFGLSFLVWTVDGNAMAPSDYSAIPIANPQLVQFNPGQTSQTVSVQINGDELVEEDESFSLIVGAALPDGNGGGVLASATGTIQNDDVALLSINDLSQLEGSSGGLTPFVFTVTSSKAFAEAVQIGYQTVPGTATDPDDYLGGPGTVTLPALTFSTTITIPVVADDLVEADESFNVVLAASPRVALGEPSGLATIVNDDVGVDAVAIPALDRLGLLLLLFAVAGAAGWVLTRRT